MAVDARSPLRILHLEDSRKDAEIIRERLIDAGLSMQMDWAANKQEFTAFLQRGEYDLVLPPRSAHSPPGVGGETGAPGAAHAIACRPRAAPANKARRCGPGLRKGRP